MYIGYKQVSFLPSVGYNMQFHLVQFRNQIFFSALVASSERKINISKNLKDETVFCSSKQAMYTVPYFFNI